MDVVMWILGCLQYLSIAGYLLGEIGVHVTRFHHRFRAGLEKLLLVGRVQLVGLRHQVGGIIDGNVGSRNGGDKGLGVNRRLGILNGIDLWRRLGCRLGSHNLNQWLGWQMVTLDVGGQRFVVAGRIERFGGGANLGGGQRGIRIWGKEFLRTRNGIANGLVIGLVLMHTVLRWQICLGTG